MFLNTLFWKMFYWKLISLFFYLCAKKQPESGKQNNGTKIFIAGRVFGRTAWKISIQGIWPNIVGFFHMKHFSEKIKKPFLNSQKELKEIKFLVYLKGNSPLASTLVKSWTSRNFGIRSAIQTLLQNTWSLFGILVHLIFSTRLFVAVDWRGHWAGEL